MDLKSGSSSNSRNRGYGGRKLCACRLPAKIFTAWTDKNPGRKFFGCELYKKPEKPGCSNGDEESICNEFVKLLSKGNIH
ncbi:hypothetical protein IGI04_001501 [Brassica rapa subsp. trilocularis]|uniref:Zinc finger GRF-type domain-containing protein n=1 Tax=Brassica rapa subsp. trilocularis TaxID=1813537 RepID=A0ABQ7NSZ9_BRACM|nr:hypothetical protein IGI04_001501 [Brassica rapa subsp. trilocularis]